MRQKDIDNIFKLLDILRSKVIDLQFMGDMLSMEVANLKEELTIATEKDEK